MPEKSFHSQYSLLGDKGEYIRQRPGIVYMKLRNLRGNKRVTMSTTEKI